MKRDPIVLGKDYILSGDDVGITRANANVLIVGASGVGKSTSCVIPTLARSEHSNLIMSYAKETDGYATAKYLQSRGYNVHILNINHPEKSTECWDPILSVQSYDDIDFQASVIVDSTIKKSADDYWQAKAKPLLKSLYAAAMMLSGESCGIIDVLTLFDQLIPSESTLSFETDMDSVFKKIAQAAPNCYAVREFKAWHSLPFKTASCVRDTLASALSTVFPESMRQLFANRPQFDLEKFLNNKEALIVITSAVDKAQECYANLFYSNTIRDILRYAATCPNGELPREIRYIFDDFACTAPIEGWANAISLFRSCGCSAIMLLQSEEQLDAIYKEEAPIIRQNCAAYCYYPGGFDDKSCEIVSKRMGMLYEDVLYASMGKVFIMQSGSGKKGVCIPRYDTLHSKEYKEFVKIAKSKKSTITVR